MLFEFSIYQLAPLQTITISSTRYSLLFQSTPFVMRKPTQQGACTQRCVYERTPTRVPRTPTRVLCREAVTRASRRQAEP